LTGGFQGLDLRSQQALLVTRIVNPLPAAFPNPTLTVHLNFEYAIDRPGRSSPANSPAFEVASRLSRPIALAVLGSCCVKD
jgi:hypothetical protein